MSTDRLARLTWIFMRIGNLTFGGGDPTMAALQTELVVRRGWLSQEQYGLVYGLARITPGTNLLAFTAAAGWIIARWVGAVLGVLAMALPSAVMVVLLTGGYQAWNSNERAMAAIGGTLAAAIGMMGTGAWQLLVPHIRRGDRFRAAVIFLGSLVLSLRFSMPPIQVLALGAIVGVFWRGPAEK
jgi:chromate transporter